MCVSLLTVPFTSELHGYCKVCRISKSAVKACWLFSPKLTPGCMIDIWKPQLSAITFDQSVAMVRDNGGT